MKIFYCFQKFRFLGFCGLIFLFLTPRLPAIQTDEAEFGLSGDYDGQVSITRDLDGRLLFKDEQVPTPVSLFDLWSPLAVLIENLGTAGAAGTAPVSNGANQLTMTDIATQAELNAKADKTISIQAGTGLTGGGDLSANRTLSIGTVPAANGGTGLTSLATGRIPFGSGTSPLNSSANLNWDAANARLQVGNGVFDPNDGSLLVTDTAKPNLGLRGIGSAGPGINGLCGDGSFASPTATAAGRVLFTFGAGGFDGSNWVYNKAVMQVLAEETWSAAATGTRMIFSTTPNGSATRVIRLYIDNAGNVGIGSSAPGERLDVISGNARIKSGALQIGNAFATAYNRLGTASTNHGLAAATDLLVGGHLEVDGDLHADGAIYRNGQRLITGPNLLDNADFNIWQRNTSVAAASGGNAGATLTYPVPRTLTLGADRWQASRAGTAMTATISRATPPGTLPTAQYALKIQATAGNPCRFYIHQSLTHESTRGLRGKWVTFAASHHMAGGTSGGNIALYKTVSGAVSELAHYNFTSTSDAWDRLAVAAQVPTDADSLVVSIQPELSASGVTTAYIANATLVEGRYVNSNERVTDPANSSVPPLPRDAADDLQSAQRFYEQGSFYFTTSAFDDASYGHFTSVHYNTAKDGDSTITLSNVNTSPMSLSRTTIVERPAFSAGSAWPQGFRAGFTGITSDPGPFGIRGDWISECPEPI